MATSSLVFSGIVPHPPIMVPEVGGYAAEEVRASINAMKDFTERLIASGAETVVLISPHAPLAARAFVAYQGETLHGSFAAFRAPEAEIEATLDTDLLNAIAQAALDEGYKVIGLDNCDLDHGSTVPLYFLQHNGWHGQVVLLGYTFLSDEDHLRFGSCIRNAADSKRNPVALIASGDLSHRLKPGAPAGYDREAYLFDQEIVAALCACAPERIVHIDPDLRKKAGECGYRSMLVALGAIEQLPKHYEVFSYEAPFGVGYLVAQLTFEQAKVKDTSEASAESDYELQSEQDLPALARLAVETFVLNGRHITPKSSKLHPPAACFVSIKTVAGDLRGCIGTTEPIKGSLEEELILNAINAATHDPRFQVLTASELPYLRYSVDVLSKLEPTSFEQLDPGVYGILVEDATGSRRGVLLPSIEGVETAEQQFEIASRKAGIPPGAEVKLFRFSATRFREVAAEDKPQ